MRVIGGKAKGKKLLSVPGDSTRPILDRVRTALFDTIRPDLPGMQILDLFGGTGSVGIEALSQGAEHCTFTELNSKAVQTIKKNLEATGLASQATVVQIDAFKYLKESGKTFNLIYIAPPQYKDMWVEALKITASKKELLALHGQIIVQIDPKEYKPCILDHLKEVRQKKYGNTILVFYSPFSS